MTQPNTLICSKLGFLPYHSRYGVSPAFKAVETRRWCKDMLQLPLLQPSKHYLNQHVRALTYVAASTSVLFRHSDTPLCWGE